jgi:hypothetical protein
MPANADLPCRLHWNSRQRPLSMLHEEETPPSGVHVAATGFRALIAQSCAFGASSRQCNQAGGRSASTKPHRTRGAAGFRSPLRVGEETKKGPLGKRGDHARVPQRRPVGSSNELRSAPVGEKCLAHYICVNLRAFHLQADLAGAHAALPADCAGVQFRSRTTTSARPTRSMP